MFQNAKQILFLLLVSLLLNLSSNAQELGKTSDYLVLVNGDTLYGQLEYVNKKVASDILRKKIRLIDKNGKSKTFRKEDFIRYKKDGFLYQSFRLYKEKSTFPMTGSFIESKYHISKASGISYFLKVMNEGKISHYKMEWSDQGSQTVWDMSLLKKENEMVMIRADQGLSGLKYKALIRYFSDCKTLQEKLRRKEIIKVTNIILFYNSKCSN